MAVKSYRHNLSLVNISQFFGFFGITSFWLLFLSQHGMSLLEIGLLESIFHGTSLLSEIPSGVLADRFSYKTNLYCSRILKILSAILMLSGHGNFWLYALGMMVNAWSYNFDSGTSAAMLYESAKEAGLSDKYLKYSSLLSGVSEATMTLGKVAAGFFIHGLLDVTYMIEIVFSLLSLLAILCMKEPAIKQQSEATPSLKTTLSTVVSTFKTNPNLLMWMLMSQFVCVLMCMFYFYYQSEISALSGWQVSLVMLVSSGLNIAAVYLASHIGKKWSAKRLFPLLVFLVGGLYSLAVSQSNLIYVVIYLLSDSIYAMFLPIYDNDLQANLPSQVRATMLSVNSMLFSLSMIIIFPVVGLIIDSYGFVPTFLGLGGCLIVGGGVMIGLRAKKVGVS